MSCRDRLLSVLVAGGMVATPGCATLFASGPDLVPISSTPEGARVKLDGFPIGKTPMTAQVERENLGIVSLDLDGYEAITAQIHKRFNAVSVINLFFWPGWLVDAVTGNISKHNKTPIAVDLVPIEKKTPEADADATQPKI